jgi:tRNA(Ile)-lysidine synthase
MHDDDLIEALRRSRTERIGGARVLVAFSGGRDSTVLLHALLQTGVGVVVALHVHHGLQAAADDWAAHCESVCAAWNVPLRILRVQVQAKGKGLESAARAARYDALRSQMEAGDVLATAHHQGDQAETVLLRLLRGSGLTGLAAMAPQTDFGPGLLWRPLLQTPREALLAYAERHRLRWVEDPHNHDPRFARSFLRTQILPRLEPHWPGCEATLARAAALIGEGADLLRELAAQDIAALAGPAPASLPASALRSLSPARRRNLVRIWVESIGLPVPGHDTLVHLDTDVLSASPDAAPVLSWAGGEFRRHRDRLFAMPVLAPVPADFRATWDGAVPLALPDGCGVLEPASSHGIPARAPRWVVRLARPSDGFRASHAGRTRTLKNLFQERGVPTWVRERTPVLSAGEQPVWVGGFGWAAHEGHAAPGDRPTIRWRHALAGAPDGA